MNVKKTNTSKKKQIFSISQIAATHPLMNWLLQMSLKHFFSTIGKILASNIPNLVYDQFFCHAEFLYA